jgi:hypothetical protein
VASPIPTRVAHAEYGDNHYRGYSVSHELAGRETWLGIVVLGVTGRRLSENERGVIDDIGLALTVADPHIWPLKIGRMVAGYGGTLAGLAAGALSLNEARIGHWSTGEAARFLRGVRQAITGLDDVRGIEAACRARLALPEPIAGLGVPFRPVDERVVVLTERIIARGRDKLEYWKLYGTVAEVLFELKGLRPNVAMPIGAACLDLGFSDREVATVNSFLGLSDFLANAAEGAIQKAPQLQSLDPASIRYVGPPPRDSGRSSR